MESGEVPTVEQRVLERLLVGLRLSDGLDLRLISLEGGRKFCDSIRRSAARLEELGLVRIVENRIKLTAAGLPLADEVIEELACGPRRSES
jgi:coproporphyrinogen III oxidase-like Fe-S oxidoreductase